MVTFCNVWGRRWRGVLYTDYDCPIGIFKLFYTALCDKVYQRLSAGRLYSPGTAVSSTNKTDRHEITEKLLKVS